MEDDEILSFKRAIEAYFGEQYSDLFELLTTHISVIDPIFTADAISDKLEAAMSDAESHGVSGDDHTKLMAIWGEIRAMREQWWNELSDGELPSE